MKMIIGGAFQGKTLLANKIYPEIVWVNGAGSSMVQFNPYIRNNISKN